MKYALFVLFAKSILFLSKFSDLTAHDVRNLKLNPECREFVASKEKIQLSNIPTLKEVLEKLKNTNIIIKIELKGPGTAIPTLEMVEDMRMVHQVHYSSFCHENIRIVRELHPERHPDGSHIYKTGALFVEPPENFIDLALAVDASEVHLKYDTCTTDRVGQIHKAGMGSMAWFRGPPGMAEDTSTKYLDVGNEDESMYQTVLKTGVQALCVNRPNILIGMLRKDRSHLTIGLV